MKGSNQASEIALRQAGTMFGTWWDRASMEHFWEAASCEIPPANEVPWTLPPSRHSLMASPRCLLPTMALHSTTRQVIQERMARGRDVIVAEALDRENDLSIHPNLSTLPDFGSHSALMLGAD